MSEALVSIHDLRKVYQRGGERIDGERDQADIQLARVLVERVEKLCVDRQRLVELPVLFELSGLLLQLCDVGHQRLTDPDEAKNAPVGPGKVSGLSYP